MTGCPTALTDKRKESGFQGTGELGGRAEPSHGWVLGPSLAVCESPSQQAVPPGPSEPWSLPSVLVQLQPGLPQSRLTTAHTAGLPELLLGQPRKIGVGLRAGPRSPPRDVLELLVQALGWVHLFPAPQSVTLVLVAWNRLDGTVATEIGRRSSGVQEASLLLAWA